MTFMRIWSLIVARLRAILRLGALVASGGVERRRSLVSGLWSIRIEPSYESRTPSGNRMSRHYPDVRVQGSIEHGNHDATHTSRAKRIPGDEPV
jgi:hypothetical protein